MRPIFTAIVCTLLSAGVAASSAMAGTPASSLSIWRRDNFGLVSMVRCAATAPSAVTGNGPLPEYNCAILTKKPTMEAETLNALANHLADLGERAREMRRYL